MNIISDDLRQVYGKAGFDLQFFGFSSDDDGETGDPKAGGNPAPVDPSGQGAEPQDGDDPFNKMVKDFDGGQPFDGSSCRRRSVLGFRRFLKRPAHIGNWPRSTTSTTRRRLSA